MSTTTSTCQGTNKARRVLRALALTAAAAATATCLGAAADAAPPQPPFGSSSLLQSEDFNDVAVKLDVETVSLYGGQGLDACSGETRMYDITHSDVETGATWTSLRNPDQLLTETTARAGSTADARMFAKTLTNQLRTCQHEPKGHWYYGKARSLTVGTGSATWFMTYDGDGSTYPTGGVAVVRDGNTFGVLELTAPSGSPVKTVKALTAAAVQRLS